MVGRIGREEQILVGLQLVDGLQHRQTELLLAGIEAGLAPRRRAHVVVGGETLLEGRGHEGQGEAEEQASHGSRCRTANGGVMRVGSVWSRRK